MEARRKPDPSLGVFETMLVVQGVPVALEAHLARLEASLRAVYESALPVETEQVVADRASGLELGRLRLTVAPSQADDEGARLTCEVEAGELDRSLHFPERPVSLRPHPIDGGLGCHKWVDRTALPSLPTGEAPLLVDGEEVLEAAWANVFAVRKGALFTPPLDGRILPGVTRSTVIELARAQGIEVRETELTRADLQEAEEAFLTNSIRGIEVVDRLEGVSLRRQDHLTRSLEEALRSRWGLATRAAPTV